MTNINNKINAERHYAIFSLSPTCNTKNCMVWRGGEVNKKTILSSDHTAKVTTNPNYITIHLTFKSTVPIVMLPLIMCLKYVFT